LIEGSKLWNYWRHGALSFADGKLCQQKMFTKTEIDLSDVSEVRWVAVAWRRQIVPRTPTRRLVIDCDSFQPADVLWLIRLIRSRVPELIQTDWLLFAYRVALPLRAGQALDKFPADLNDPFVKQLQLAYLFVAAILLISAGGIFLSVVFRQPATLLVPLAPILFWLAMRFTKGREPGEATRRRVEADQAFLSLLVVLSLVVLGCFFLFGDFRPHRMPDLAFFLLPVSIFVILCMGMMFERFKQQLRRHDAECNARPAAQRWEEGERLGRSIV
jgi:hypothetical protein